MFLPFYLCVCTTICMDGGGKSTFCELLPSSEMGVVDWNRLLPLWPFYLHLEMHLSSSCTTTTTMSITIHNKQCHQEMEDEEEHYPIVVPIRKM